MIQPLQKSIQSIYRTWMVHCGLVISISLSLIQIQASPDALYAGRVTPAPVNQQVQQLGQLELGKPIERELTGGHSHPYQMALAAGQYVKSVVEQ
jgi:hypothetical protein